MLRCTDIKCPMCGRIADGCLVAEDGEACICVRTPSEKRCGSAGWLHQIDIDPEKIKAGTFRKCRKRSINWERLMDLYREKARGMIGFPYMDMRGGFDGDCYCVPSFTAKGHVCGIMRVSTDLKTKRWVEGSQVGIFINRFTWNPDKTYVLITEGLSDTKTANRLRMRAIGRGSCNQSTDEVVQYLNLYNSCEMSIIVADNDADKPGNPGVAGAQELLKTLQEKNLPSVIVVPPQPGWDLTDWVDRNERGARAAINWAAKKELKRLAEKRKLEEEVHDIMMLPFDLDVNTRSSTWHNYSEFARCG